MGVGRIGKAWKTMKKHQKITKKNKKNMEKNGVKRREEDRKGRVSGARKVLEFWANVRFEARQAHSLDELSLFPLAEHLTSSS